MKPPVSTSDMHADDRYFEDWTIGEVLEAGSFTLDEAKIVEFARDYDPQPFHVDPEAAAASKFGRLIASGWQTAAITMRLIVDSGIFGRHGGIVHFKLSTFNQHGEAVMTHTAIVLVPCRPGEAA